MILETITTFRLVSILVTTTIVALIIYFILNRQVSNGPC